MIVADTNLISYLLIAGARTAEAQSVLRKDPAWSAPVLWRSEFRNVLALYVRQGHLALNDALAYADEAARLIGANEHLPDSAPVLRLAESSGCSAYDCEFVHLARQLGVPLVTSDRKVLQAFPETAISIEAFGHQP